MKKSIRLLTLAASLMVATTGYSVAKEVELDRVAVIVNNGVVLESEIADLIKTVKTNAEKNNQSLPADRVLRVQVTDKLISDALVMQIGERMGIQISDARLDDTLSNMAKDSNMNLEQMRQIGRAHV